MYIIFMLHHRYPEVCFVMGMVTDNDNNNYDCNAYGRGGGTHTHKQDTNICMVWGKMMGDILCTSNDVMFSPTPHPKPLSAS